jgi:hypothetical protein
VRALRCIHSSFNTRFASSLVLVETALGPTGWGLSDVLWRRSLDVVLRLSLDVLLRLSLDVLLRLSLDVLLRLSLDVLLRLSLDVLLRPFE